MKRNIIWDLLEGKAPLSPAAQSLGWKLLALDRDAGTSRNEFRIPAGFLNFNGAVQGGFIVAMLDQCMVAAALARLEPGEVVVTLSINSHFLAPAREGTLTGTGLAIGKGKSTRTAEARLTDEGGKLIAFGSSTLQIIRPTEPPAAK